MAPHAHVSRWNLAAHVPSRTLRPGVTPAASVPVWPAGGSTPNPGEGRAVPWPRPAQPRSMTDAGQSLRSTCAAGSETSGRAVAGQEEPARGRDVGLGHRSGDDGPARVGERAQREAGPRGATPRRV